MHLESIVYLESNISNIFSNVTDCENIIWRRELKEARSIDDKHFIEYSKKNNYPTFFTVVKKTKNKIYELEFTNNQMEGHMVYSFQKEEDKTVVTLSLDVTFVDAKLKVIAKQRLKRRWKGFIEDLKRV